MPFKRFQKHTCNKPRFSDSLNGRRWRFLKSGSDDFREAFPPIHGSIVIQHQKGPVPVLLPSLPEGLGKRQRKAKRVPVQPQRGSPKLCPALHVRKTRIAQVEYCLSQHPLALYPHLEESVPAELFKEVLSVLDPEMLPASEDAGADVDHKQLIPSTVPSQLEQEENRRTGVSRGPKGKDPYLWFSIREVAAREREARLNYVPPLDENVARATKEFCSWLHSLGGEKCDIDEDTIISLFDTGYGSKPPLAVLINVLEPKDLPAELRKDAGIPPPWAKRSHSKGSCQGKREKIRYGAWYLDPKTWTKQDVNKPSQDPRNGSILNLRGALSEKEAEILQLHGTHAFREFLERKGYRIPEGTWASNRKEEEEQDGHWAPFWAVGLPKCPVVPVPGADWKSQGPNLEALCMPSVFAATAHFLSFSETGMLFRISTG
ncbi:protein FAM47E-like [Varanus komodoensis]|uniref:protein FAM47E-like n=1 Tax=Varanus komodoensis TaxID=61221 RepID=UPI001CF783BB|nr:protein FAM47E-like [Varanus komodoensis]